MSGFPIEKAKEAMKLSLDGLYPEDTFNLITFAGDTYVLFEQPVPATQANLEKAQAFLESRQGGGGTEMMKAIKAALDPSGSQAHLRIVCFMTDAFVGNDNEIIAEIQKHPKARVFSFGIGSSVNRSLLDKMAEAGNGEVEYVALTDDGSKAAKKFYERVRTPLLTDLSIDWNGMPVADVHPNKLSDLFSAKPMIVNGRYTKAASGTIKLKGKVAGQEYTREITLNLPETEAANDVLATLWARRRVDEISNEALKGGKGVEDLNKQITNLGLEFRIMTQFTSFVAVEDRVVNQNGKPVTIQVPVAIPEGVDRKMTVGETQETVTVSGGGGGGGVLSSRQISNLPVAKRRAPMKRASGQGSGVGYGSGGSGSGTGSGSGNGIGPRPSATPNSLLTLSPSAGIVSVDMDAPGKPPIRMTPEMIREQKIKEKLHSWVYALVERLRKGDSKPGANEVIFVRDGKAEIQIVLNARSPEALDKLKALGLEVDSSKDGINIFGRIAIDKLLALAELEGVKLVLPRVR